jgi:DNA topoisomerase-2
MFKIYYGKDSRTRKIELSTPHNEFTIEEIQEIEDSKSITCNRHLTAHGKFFMLKAIERTIPSFYDGFTPVRRKAYALFLRNRNEKAKKIFQWAGRIADEMMYHHGEASMHQAIIKMSQSYLGSNYFPLLEKQGQMGSRNKKGKDAGSPRYVGASLNRELADVLFLRRDMEVLISTYEDSIKVEPKYYLPILPLCILETRAAVTYGWQSRIYARDLHAVARLLKNLINGKEITPGDMLIPPSRFGYKGEICYIDGSIYAKGLYTNIVSKNTIIITELALFVNPSKYVKVMGKNPLIVNIKNYSTDTNIEIHMEMVNGYMEKIENLDIFLHIKQRFNEELNFVGENGVIEHFSCVYDILYKTFLLNKQKYIQRARRDSLLLRHMILREENILRFLNSTISDKSIITKFCGEDDDIIDGYLTTDNYDRINSTIINSHSTYTTDELEIELEKNREFSYIKHTQFGESSKKNMTKRMETLVELKQRLADICQRANDKPFPFASTYREEVRSAYVTLCKYVS